MHIYVCTHASPGHTCYYGKHFFNANRKQSPGTSVPGDISIKAAKPPCVCVCARVCVCVWERERARNNAKRCESQGWVGFRLPDLHPIQSSRETEQSSPTCSCGEMMLLLLASAGRMWREGWRRAGEREGVTEGSRGGGVSPNATQKKMSYEKGIQEIYGNALQQIAPELEKCGEKDAVCLSNCFNAFTKSVYSNMKILNSNF